MNRNASESAVDRLIALAQQKPARADAGASDEGTELGAAAVWAAVGERAGAQSYVESAAAVWGVFAVYRAAAGDEQPDAAVDGGFVPTELRNEMRQSVAG